MTGRLRRVPLPLALLLAVAFLEAVTWTLVIPALQGPDEARHFSYVQRIGEGRDLPWHPGGGHELTGDARYSTELRLALRDGGLGPLAANLGARPLWTSADEAFWRTRADKLTSAQRRDGGYVSAMKNPPLYYLYEAVPYVAARSGSFYDREFVMRMANVPLLLIAVVFAWLVCGELAGAGWPRVVGTAAVALQPQLLNVTATVDPDILLVAEWSAALWLMIAILRRGLSVSRVAWLVGLSAASCLTHARGIPLLLPAAATILLALGRERGVRLLRPGVVLPASLVGLLLVVLGAAGRGGRGNAREFFSYVWQFYLPHLGFMKRPIGLDWYDFREAYVDRFYGTFAQLEVGLPHGLTTFLFWATLAGLVALAAVLLRRRASILAEARVATVLVLAIIGLVLGLHLGAYRAMLGQPSDPVFTGRYLLPLVPLFGAAIALVLRELPARAAAAAGVLVAAGLALQFVSIGQLVERFYA